MNIDTNIFNKSVTVWNQQNNERIIHHNQVGFIPGMQGFFDIPKSVWYIPHWQIEEQQSYEHLKKRQCIN